uniref:Uncharacterized protein n=1 Tax=Arion vulgaris TaxID=1028688 RepID=A0A0B7AD04_9EUPU
MPARWLETRILQECPPYNEQRKHTFPMPVQDTRYENLYRLWLTTNNFEVYKSMSGNVERRYHVL